MIIIISIMIIDPMGPQPRKHESVRRAYDYMCV